jgi:hypothetical protein
MKQRGVAATLLFLILFKSIISQKHKDDERSNSRSSNWSSNLRDVLGTFASQVDYVASNLRPINDVSQKLPSQIKEVVYKLPAPIKEAASKLHSKVNDVAGDISSKIKNVASELPSQTKEVTSVLHSQIRDISNKFSSQMKEAADKLPSQMKSATQKLDTQVTDMIEKIAPDMDTGTKKKIVYGMAGAGAALGTATVALPALGFTEAGVAAGSVAANVQSLISGGVGATAFGALQSAGAAGIAGGTKALLAGIGAYAAQKFTDGDLPESGYIENEDTATEMVFDEGDKKTDANESNSGAKDRLDSGAKISDSSSDDFHNEHHSNSEDIVHKKEWVA